MPSTAKPTDPPRRHWLVSGLATGAMVVASLPALAAPASAVTISVSTQEELSAAISTANASADPDTITLTKDFAITSCDLQDHAAETALPAVSSPLTIAGAGHTVTGNAGCRVLQLSGGALTIEDVTITGSGGRISGLMGGALYIGGGSATVRRSTFAGNAAGLNGGAIHSEGTLTIADSAFSANSAEFGGAVDTAGSGSSTIVRSTFSGNNANGGGAAYVASPFTIDGSSFIGNTAVDYSGALVVGHAGVIRNSTFVNNTTNTMGGAISAIAVGTEIVHSTFVGNQAKIGAAIVGQGSVTLSVSRSVFADNVGGTACYHVTGASNVLESGSCVVGDTVVGGDLMLADMSAATGPGQQVLVPRLGSPVRDTVECDSGIAVDQLGSSRPQGVRCDAGAIEGDVTPPIVTPILSPADPDGSAGWYRAAVDVSWQISDPEGGITAQPCPAIRFDLETAGHEFGCRAESFGGSTYASVTIKRDGTAPTITWAGGPAEGATYPVGTLPPAPTCTAADALSGPDGCAVSGYSNVFGVHTLTATARDIAGNVVTQTRTYAVGAATVAGSLSFSRYGTKLTKAQKKALRALVAQVPPGVTVVTAATGVAKASKPSKADKRRALTRAKNVRKYLISLKLPGSIAVSNTGRLPTTAKKATRVTVTITYQ